MVVEVVLLVYTVRVTTHQFPVLCQNPTQPAPWENKAAVRLTVIISSVSFSESFTLRATLLTVIRHVLDNQNSEAPDSLSMSRFGSLFVLVRHKFEYKVPKAPESAPSLLKIARGVSFTDNIDVTL